MVLYRYSSTEATGTTYQEGSYGDFWNDIKDQEEKTKELSFAQNAARFCQPCVAFYRPSGSFGQEEEEEEEGNNHNNNIHHYGFLSSDELVQRDLLGYYRKLRTLCGVMVPVSLFFWGWAVKNTLSMSTGQDLGIYSFMTVLWSCHWVLFRTRGGPNHHHQRVSTLPVRILVTASYALVCANYLLGVVFALTVGSEIYAVFATYCSIFTILWGAATVYCFRLLHGIHLAETQMHNLVQQQQEQDYDIEGVNDLF